MTDTLIAIISIFLGMIGANIFAIIKKKYSFGFIGNTITGIYGSIFFIKMFGRLGFGPMFIMKSGEPNSVLFLINIFVSLFGGAIGLVITKIIVDKMNKNI